MGRGGKNILNNAVTKKIAFGATKAAKFVGNQLKHPAVKQFIGDSAKLAIASGGNPEVAAGMIGARAAQEGNNIIDRTMNHYTKGGGGRGDGGIGDSNFGGSDSNF